MKNINIKILEENISLENLCIKYNIEFEPIAK